MIKNSPIQLSIFDVITEFNEDHFWNEFKVVVNKLKKDGFRSIDECWWRSRYYDHVECPNSAQNKNGFEYQNAAAINWKFIWNKHKIEITL